MANRRRRVSQGTVLQFAGIALAGMMLCIAVLGSLGLVVVIGCAALVIVAVLILV